MYNYNERIHMEERKELFKFLRKIGFKKPWLTLNFEKDTTYFPLFQWYEELFLPSPGARTVLCIPIL